LVAIVREEKSNSRIAFQATAAGGDRFTVVLDFDFSSRFAQPNK